MENDELTGNDFFFYRFLSTVHPRTRRRLFPVMSFLSLTLPWLTLSFLSCLERLALVLSANFGRRTKSTASGLRATTLRALLVPNGERIWPTLSALRFSDLKSRYVNILGDELLYFILCISLTCRCFLFRLATRFRRATLNSGLLPQSPKKFKMFLFYLWGSVWVYCLKGLLLFLLKVTGVNIKKFFFTGELLSVYL